MITKFEIKKKCLSRDSNQRPTASYASALPTELLRNLCRMCRFSYVYLTMLCLYPNTAVAEYRYCILWFVIEGESQGYANPLVSLAIGLIINAIHVLALF